MRSVSSSLRHVVLMNNLKLSILFYKYLPGVLNNFTRDLRRVNNNVLYAASYMYVLSIAKSYYIYEHIFYLLQFAYIHVAFLDHKYCIITKHKNYIIVKVLK